MKGLCRWTDSYFYYGKWIKNNGYLQNKMRIILCFQVA